MRFLVLLLMVLALGACVDADTPPKPERVRVDESSFAGIEYTEVVLPSGDIIPCLWMGDGAGNGGLSCGWDYGNGRYTE